jgi:hypothetical protein
MVGVNKLATKWNQKLLLHNKYLKMPDKLKSAPFSPVLGTKKSRGCIDCSSLSKTLL